MNYDITLLSVCEYHVAALCAKGYSHKEIGKLNNRSHKTTDKHISNIRRKLKLKGGVEWMRLLRMFPGP